MLKFTFILFISILMISCKQEDKTLETFVISTIKGVECTLYYWDGHLFEIRQTKKNKKDFTLTSYSFYENGRVAAIEEVLGDSILSTTRYYSNGKIKSKNNDLDLNPNDTLFILHGEYIEYYESGALQSIGRFERGEMRDTFKYFDQQGKLIQFEVYDEYLKTQ